MTTYAIDDLVSFSGSDGAQPIGGLVTDSAGNLYGTTDYGGASNDGTVFEIRNTGTVNAPVYASAPTTLVSFDGSNGGGPASTLIIDGNGNLYGTAAVGGADNVGTVFEIVNLGTSVAPRYEPTPKTLVSFTGPDGSQPAGGLVADSAGNLFGTTSYGGDGGNGTIFEIDNNGSASDPNYSSMPTTLVSFYGSNYNGLSGDLLLDGAGDLIGIESVSGAQDAGQVIEIVNQGTVEAPKYASSPTTIVAFDGRDGSRPEGGLVADSRGDLFGTTERGGDHDAGTIFEIENLGTAAAPHYTTTSKKLASFDGSSATGPLGRLLLDGAGNLYGTTVGGGSSPTLGREKQGGTGNGTVFELENNGTAASPSYASKPTILASFDGTNGAFPYAGLIMDAAGHLLGTTRAGGANGPGLNGEGDGTVFELVPSTPPADPTITGTHASDTTDEAPVTPFAGVTVSDPNGGTETLTIALQNGGGTLAGMGLVANADGTYALSGSAATVTGELDALSFTPTAPDPGTSVATTFVLTDASSAGTSVSDAGTMVTDTAAPAPPPAPPPPTDTVSIDPDAAFIGRGTFVLTGQAASSVGVASVEISARVGGIGGTQTDLGAATVNADGTWRFVDHVGAQVQGFITATETDAAGGSASVTPLTSLQAGIRHQRFQAVQNFYTPGGEMYAASAYEMNDGHRTVRTLDSGQALASQYDDTFANGGVPDTTFSFTPGYGHDVIEGLRLQGPEPDRLSLPTADFASFAQVLQDTQNTPSGALIHDNLSGDTLLLAGVSKVQLAQHRADFSFHA